MSDLVRIYSYSHLTWYDATCICLITAGFHSDPVTCTYSRGSNKLAVLLLGQQENMPCARLFATCALIRTLLILYQMLDVCTLCFNSSSRYFIDIQVRFDLLVIQLIKCTQQCIKTRI